MIPLQPWRRRRFFVLFTNDTKTSKFFDGVMDPALQQKKSGVHVKGQPSALIPSKVTAYRWRSITWDELEALFK